MKIKEIKLIIHKSYLVAAAVTTLFTTKALMASSIEDMRKEVIVKKESSSYTMISNVKLGLVLNLEQAGNAAYNAKIFIDQNPTGFIIELDKNFRVKFHKKNWFNIRTLDQNGQLQKRRVPTDLGPYLIKTITPKGIMRSLFSEYVYEGVLQLNFQELRQHFINQSVVESHTHKKHKKRTSQ